MNLNELHVPDDADTALDWAVRREFGMRYDSYREAQLWGVVAEQFRAKQFRCQNPEAQWIADMEEQFSVKVKEQR